MTGFIIDKNRLEIVKRIQNLEGLPGRARHPTSRSGSVGASLESDSPSLPAYILNHIHTTYMVYIRTILSGLFLALTFSRTGGAKHDLYPPIELRDLWLLFVVGGRRIRRELLTSLVPASESAITCIRYPGRIGSIHCLTSNSG